MSEIISSRTNPLIKQIRALHQHKERAETGLFLIEGIHHIGEAIQAGWKIETLVYSTELLTSEYGLSLVRDQNGGRIRCTAVTGAVFTDIASKDNPQGIIAVAHQRNETLEDLTPNKFTWSVACVAPQDPGNVGTILRTLDAAGADGLFLLDGGVELYHPSLIRASMGTIFWKPVIRATFAEFTGWARKHELQLIGSSAHAAKDYRTFKHEGQPTVLLLGSEQKGLTQEQLATCDLVLSMPMKGRGSSLNLAVAAGILLYSMMDQ